MTSARRSPGRRSWAITAIRRTLGTVRYMHQELELASEAMIRTARVPQPRPASGNGASRSAQGNATAATAAPGGGVKPAA
jgi:hypothetical protein